MAKFKALHCSSLISSQSGQRVMFGMANGQIRIQQLEEPHDLAQLGPQWTLSVHDNNYGHITALASSFDGQLIPRSSIDLSTITN